MKQSTSASELLTIRERIVNESEPLTATVICLAYNHGDCIKRAIESVLSQRVSFRTEILIHDDASSDETPLILDFYKSRYPGLIRCIIQTENQYSKGTWPNEIFFEEPHGEFVAWIDGDDYWISDDKLEEQVEFLKNNPEYAACFCESKSTNRNQNDSAINIAIPDASKRKLSTVRTIDLLTENPLGACTSSVLIRKLHLPSPMPPIFARFPFLDWPLWLFLSTKGKIAILHGIFTAYSVSEHGIWSRQTELAQRASIIKFLTEAYEIAPSKFHSTITQELAKRTATQVMEDEANTTEKVIHQSLHSPHGWNNREYRDNFVAVDSNTTTINADDNFTEMMSMQMLSRLKQFGIECKPNEEVDYRKAVRTEYKGQNLARAAKQMPFLDFFGKWTNLLISSNFNKKIFFVGLRYFWNYSKPKRK